MTGVYRIPLRRVFNKKRIPGDPSWDQIYGKKRCVSCRQYFHEGDVYFVTNDGEYSHLSGMCPAKGRKVRS